MIRGEAGFLLMLTAALLGALLVAADCMGAGMEAVRAATFKAGRYAKEE